MAASSNGNGYSAEVRLELVIDGRSLDVEQVGPRSCLLAEPIDHPPGEAEVVMHVDGQRRTWRVAIPQGISRISKRVVFG
ncbi:MAG TPA: hypothetical protein VMV69_23140 [Pirellulales bacterium]|nr:hypothetical protein [Pirellulales bacterium]